MNPFFAGRCLPAATALAEHVENGDIVIWPDETGGLAWKAAGKPYRSNGGKPHRVFCVMPDYAPFSEELWFKLDTAAVFSGNHIIPVRLQTALAASSPTDRYPGFILRILDKLFPLSDPGSEKTPAGDEASFLKLHVSPEDNSILSTDNTPGLFKSESVVCNTWVQESEGHLFISRDAGISERILAAAAASAAGLLPLIPLNTGEAASAAALIDYFLRDENRKFRFRFLITVEEDWNAVAIFRSHPGITVLTPLSEADYQGALRWASAAAGSVLIVDPGKSSLPSRKRHTVSWDTDEFLILKEKKDGETGSVLLITPGILAREAGKAADRLSKEKYSVSLLALRFPWPSEIQKIRDIAGLFNLVIVMDPSDNPGGMKAELGLNLGSLRELHVAVTEKFMNGKDLAQYAASLLREDRFHRTVDDVKKDRWR